jgi:hypothetical protein
MMAKGKDPLMQQARRDFRVAMRPQKQAIKRARRQGTRDFNEAQQRVAQVTGALLGQLGQIPGAYAGQTGGIIGNVTSGIGALGEQLGQNSIGQVPVAEQAAGIANVGAIGSGAIEQIAGQQQNMQDYLASGAQQGAVQGAVTSRNYLKDYQGFLKDNRQQQVDLASQSKDAILQRLDQLKQEQFDRTMALKQLGMQQAQIDQANRQLDAEIWYMQQQAKRALKADRHKPKPEPKPTAEQYGAGGYASVGGNWWPPTETSMGGNAGALGQGLAPSTTLPANAPAQAVIQWLQTQPIQTQPGRQAAAAQVSAWVQSKGGSSYIIRTLDNGALQLENYSGRPIDPEVQGVLDAYNNMIGGA